MLKRLTVHLDKVKKTRVETGNTKGKSTSKTILTNTISVRNLTSDIEIKTALSGIRKDHKIAKCKKPDHKTWKVGDEMWYTSNETL
tara:strand:- start:816 stop:1073 length:258 start_codon:yes stop_codon:yes gene_type:complete